MASTTKEDAMTTGVAPRPRSKKMTTSFEKLLQMTETLRHAGIEHQLDQHRDDCISILATIPGERWEIDILASGEIEFERFRSDGDLHTESTLLTAIRHAAA